MRARHAFALRVVGIVRNRTLAVEERARRGHRVQPLLVIGGTPRRVGAPALGLRLLRRNVAHPALLVEQLDVGHGSAPLWRDASRVHARALAGARRCLAVLGGARMCATCAPAPASVLGCKRLIGYAHARAAPVPCANPSPAWPQTSVARPLPPCAAAKPTIRAHSGLRKHSQTQAACPRRARSSARRPTMKASGQ